MSSDDSWRIATGEDNGKPLVFRIRNHPPAFARQDEFPKLLAVRWEYESPNEHGMPSDNVVCHMKQLEDLLAEAFEEAGQAFLTVAATGNGVREWQWYARNQDDVMKVVNETLGELEPFPVEFIFQDDPEWLGYSGFLQDG